MKWEVRQTNFMGGYDTVIPLPWKWMANLASVLISGWGGRGCTGEGCTAGCTFVARRDAE